MAADIAFTPEVLKRFKKRYEECKARDDEVFTFEGHEVLVSYAGYMIEYLEAEFARREAVS